MSNVHVACTFAACSTRETEPVIASRRKGGEIPTQGRTRGQTAAAGRERPAGGVVFPVGGATIRSAFNRSSNNLMIVMNRINLEEEFSKDQNKKNSSSNLILITTPDTFDIALHRKRAVSMFLFSF